jgi:hypothetical protein
VLLRELEVAHRDRLEPGHPPLDRGLAVVHVRVEPADQPADADAVEPARQVRLLVVPADLAVRDQIEARVRLLLERLDGNVVLDLLQLIEREVAAIESVDGVAQAGWARLVRDLGIAADGGRDHRWVLAGWRTHREGRGHDPPFESSAGLRGQSTRPALTERRPAP